MRLENKVALISGGARGMGAAEAMMFAREGARVVIGDILEEEGRRTEATINESGGECLFVRLDVTREADWQRAVATAVARFGKLDILVNNAGVVSRGVLEDTTSEEWDRVMGVNAKGVFLGTKAAIPEMRKAGGGSIINISSISGMVGQSNIQPVYNASKGAVRIFTKSAAVQYAKDGIRVNSVHPGAVDTPMAGPRLADPELQREAAARIPLGRTGRPEDIAYGVLFLASDESSFVTGSELVIDGGYTAE
jgi:cyclopentanol dehydrogenase